MQNHLEEFVRQFKWALSPGAKATIEGRGYPIQAVERPAVKKWLEQLRTPGTGIIR